MFTRHLSQWYPINFNRLQGHIYEKLEKSFARNTAPPELQAPQLTFPDLALQGVPPLDVVGVGRERAVPAVVLDCMVACKHLCTGA